MDIKKINIKTWVIIILGGMVIISFIFGQNNNINYHEDEINKLKKDNIGLLSKNDSLNLVNHVLDSTITVYDTLLAKNDRLIVNTQEELDRLKKKRDEIPNYVNSLSANGVASNLSDYLRRRD